MPQLGKDVREPVRVRAAIVDAERAAAEAPGAVVGHEEGPIVFLGDHGQGALGVEKDRAREMPDKPIDRDRRRSGLPLDGGGEAVDDLGDAGEEDEDRLGPVEHIEKDVLAAEVQGQVEDAAPVDVAGDPAISFLQGLGKSHQPEERGAGEGRRDVKLEVRPPGGNDLRRGVGLVFDPTADHLRQEVPGGVMNGTENGKIKVPVFVRGPNRRIVRRGPVPFSSRPRRDGADPKRNPRRNRSGRACATMTDGKQPRRAARRLQPPIRRCVHFFRNTLKTL